ncbi:hypothetical protein IWQ60_010980 [Tieghemiomyces parasiticus]|uniref:Ribosomal protein S15 n=1 Tax=Tieghemiomyces parasiticus TaxID=78921 RepID=A0A9W7ZKD1_9FUNG|nr:hypothetical protein IWQ60_010980 [Tieghemiomyces parasiticus]
MNSTMLRSLATSSFRTVAKPTAYRALHTSPATLAKLSRRKLEIRESVQKAQEAAQAVVEERRQRMNTPFLNSLVQPQELFQSTLDPASTLDTAPATLTDTAEPVPKLILGLQEDDKKFLLETIPEVQLSFKKVGSEDEIPSTFSAVENIHKSLSLSNAGSPDITKWNKQVAIRTFGRKEGDSGSSEVQAAIWTIRINNLKQHLIKNPKDRYNNRRYTMLQHKRAKILRYLKRCSLERYAKCLKQLGLRPDMVENQILPVSRVTEAD